MTGTPARPARRPSAGRRPAPARRPSPRLVALLAAVVLVIVGIVVVSCGSSESAADVVSRAFGKGKAIKTANVDIKLGLSGSAAAGGDPLNLSLSGPYEAGENGKASFDFAVDLGGVAGSSGAGTLALVGAKGKTYVRIGGQPFSISSAVVDDLKDSKAKKDSGLSFSSLGISPKTWLKDPKKVGDEQLKGEDVQHVRAGVDVGRLGADLQKLLTRADKAAGSSKQTKQAVSTVSRLQKDIKSAQIDIWAASGEGALRRMKVDLKLTSGAVAIDFGLSKIGDAVTIDAPKNALPLQQLLNAVGQAQGSSGTSTGKTGASAPDSGTSTSTTPSDGSSAGGTSTSSAYDQCVAAAGEDVSKLQQCAKLAP